MKYFIYKITNNINNKIYIGYTSNSPHKRWNAHKVRSKKIKDCPYLHNAMNYYGVDNFSFCVLTEHNTVREALDKEIELIEEFRSRNPNIGYNISKGGDVGGFVDEYHRQNVVLRMTTNNPMKVLRTNSGSFKEGHIQVFTSERKKNCSISKIGTKNPMFGNKKAADHLNTVKYTCDHCGTSCTSGNFTRWHGNNCRLINKDI